MKYLRLFENNNEIRMRDVLKKTRISGVAKEYNEICSLLTDFIKFENPKLDIKIVRIFYYENDLDKIGDEGLVVSFIDNRYNENGIILMEPELKEFYKFMEDPELYKNIKKFNL